MPTEVVKSIGATGDYTSLAAWEADCPANLVTADQVWIGELQNQLFSSAATLLTFSGKTTDATRKIILRCQTGASFADNASVRSNALYYNESNGAAIKCTSIYTTVIDASAQANVLFQGLQVSASASVCINMSSSTVIDSCILSQANNAGPWARNKIINSLITRSGNGGPVVYASGTLNMYGCTLIHSSGNSAAASGVYITIIVKNTAFFGCNAQGAWDASSDYNATDLASATGAHSLTSLTFSNEVENTTNDFRAKSTGNLKAGTPDSTNTPDDITGLTRDATTPWIGCWEVTTSGFTGSASLSIGTTTLSASGTFPFIGASTVSVGSATLSGSATHTTPTYTGTSIVTIGGTTLAASGSFPFIGSSTVTAGPATLAASGDFTTPVYTASASVTIGPTVFTAIGDFSTGPSAVGTITVGPVSAIGSAVYTSLSTGTADVTIGPATSAGSGTFTAPTYTGSGNLIGGSVTLSGSAVYTSLSQGTAVITVGPTTFAGTGVFTPPTFTGTIDVTIGPATFEAFEEFAFRGTGHFLVGAAFLTGVVTYREIGQRWTRKRLIVEADQPRLVLG